MILALGRALRWLAPSQTRGVGGRPLAASAESGELSFALFPAPDTSWLTLREIVVFEYMPLLTPLQRENPKWLHLGGT